MKPSEPRTPASIGISLAIAASSVAASDRIEAAIHRGDARELDVTVVHREPFVVHEHRPVTNQGITPRRVL